MAKEKPELSSCNGDYFLFNAAIGCAYDFFSQRERSLCERPYGGYRLWVNCIKWSDYDCQCNLADKKIDFFFLRSYNKYGGNVMFRILLAEDEKNLRNVLASTLTKEGYCVIAVPNGRLAFDKFCEEKFDLVITDIMMPGMDGNELTEKLRTLSPDIPVLMLTALETLEDKEKGFGAGADDYLTKPFALKELLLRIKALLRRYGEVYEKRIVLAHTELHYDTNVAIINGKTIELTKKEFLLLFKLLSHPNVIFSREQLMNDVWGYDSESADRTVDTHIKWLRDKTENEDFKIVTVRGLGYKAVLL